MMNIMEKGSCSLEDMRTVPIQTSSAIETAVNGIIENVRLNGDSAVREYTKKFDGIDIENFAVSEDEFNAAWQSVSDGYKKLLAKSADNIRAFHSRQKREGFVVCDRMGINPEQSQHMTPTSGVEFSFKTRNRGEGVLEVRQADSDAVLDEKTSRALTGIVGIALGQRIIPLKSVGLYVPGGTASYPSSVLMNAIPPVIAGVENIVIVTPPDKSGAINPNILAAAMTAGVKSVYKVGGAQAIAALAYGTESIPRVDKIVGPGNAYVATAKRKVYGLVDIDMVAGPSEILVIADEYANPKYIAADLLSQAEHDKLSSAILVTTSRELALKVQSEVERQIDKLLRRDIARKSIDDNGKIIIVNDVTEAIDIANYIAPEHLELCVENPMSYLGSVSNAGSVFLGENSPEALGDYWAGLNHTLPTSGTARFSSPLSVDDFVKKSQFVFYSRKALGEAAKNIEAFAESEGLTGHARSISVRFGGDEK